MNYKALLTLCVIMGIISIVGLDDIYYGNVFVWVLIASVIVGIYATKKIFIERYDKRGNEIIKQLEKEYAETAQKKMHFARGTDYIEKVFANTYISFRMKCINFLEDAFENLKDDKEVISEFLLKFFLAFNDMYLSMEQEERENTTQEFALVCYAYISFQYILEFNLQKEFMADIVVRKCFFMRDRADTSYLTLSNYSKMLFEIFVCFEDYLESFYDQNSFYDKQNIKKYNTFTEVIVNIITKILMFKDFEVELNEMRLDWLDMCKREKTGLIKEITDKTIKIINDNN